MKILGFCVLLAFTLSVVSAARLETVPDDESLSPHAVPAPPGGGATDSDSGCDAVCQRRRDSGTANDTPAADAPHDTPAAADVPPHDTPTGHDATAAAADPAAPDPTAPAGDSPSAPAAGPDGTGDDDGGANVDGLGCDNFFLSLRRPPGVEEFSFGADGQRACDPCSDEEAQLNSDIDDLIALNKDINKKKNTLHDLGAWTREAHAAIEKLDRQIKTNTDRTGIIKSSIDDLNGQREVISGARVKRKIEADLKTAHRMLSILEGQELAVDTKAGTLNAMQSTVQAGVQRVGNEIEKIRREATASPAHSV